MPQTRREPPKLSRESAKEQTRARLLAAGRKVFAARGLDGAQIRDVIGEAGLAIGTFYLHFKGKEDLFAAVIEESANELRARLRAARLDKTPGLTLVQRVENAIRAFCEFVLSEKDLFRVLFREGMASLGGASPKHVSMGARMIERAIKDLREDMERGATQRLFSRENLDRLAPAIIGMCSTVGFRLLADPHPDLEGTTKFLTRMVLGGIAAQRGA